MIEELIKAAQTEVDNHSIYVWGGSGQLCCPVAFRQYATQRRMFQLHSVLLVHILRHHKEV